jgi:hypothetical protein
MKIFNILFLAFFFFSFSNSCFAKTIKEVSSTTESIPDFETIYLDGARGLMGGVTTPTKAYKRTSDGQLVPVILNGGMLPGPQVVARGEDYFLHNFLPGLTNKFLILLLSISVVMFIVGGIMYLTAQGDTDMTKKAFDTIFWSVLGLVIAILSFAAVKFLVGINFTP